MSQEAKPDYRTLNRRNKDYSKYDITDDSKIAFLVTRARGVSGITLRGQRDLTGL